MIILYYVTAEGKYELFQLYVATVNCTDLGVHKDTNKNADKESRTWTRTTRAADR